MKLKSVTVTIDGNDYQLIGDDEALIRRSAEEANSQISRIKSKYKDELPPMTVTMLAMLNLAETLEQERENFRKEKQLLNDEIVKMSEHLSEFLKESKLNE